VNPAILRDLYKRHPFAAVLEFSANVVIGLVEKLDQAEAVDFVPGHPPESSYRLEGFLGVTGVLE